MVGKDRREDGPILEIHGAIAVDGDLVERVAERPHRRRHGEERVSESCLMECLGRLDTG
jgi:hypothetical protein